MAFPSSTFSAKIMETKEILMTRFYSLVLAALMTASFGASALVFGADSDCLKDVRKKESEIRAKFKADEKTTRDNHKKAIDECRAKKGDEKRECTKKEMDAYKDVHKKAADDRKTAMDEWKKDRKSCQDSMKADREAARAKKKAAKGK